MAKPICPGNTAFDGGSPKTIRLRYLSSQHREEPPQLKIPHFHSCSNQPSLSFFKIFRTKLYQTLHIWKRQKGRSNTLNYCARAGCLGKQAKKGTDLFFTLWINKSVVFFSTDISHFLNSGVVSHTHDNQWPDTPQTHQNLNRHLPKPMVCECVKRICKPMQGMLRRQDCSKLLSS